MLAQGRARRASATNRPDQPPLAACPPLSSSSPHFGERQHPPARSSPSCRPVVVPITVLLFPACPASICSVPPLYSEITSDRAPAQPRVMADTGAGAEAGSQRGHKHGKAALAKNNAAWCRAKQYSLRRKGSASAVLSVRAGTGWRAGRPDRHVGGHGDADPSAGLVTVSERSVVSSRK